MSEQTTGLERTRARQRRWIIVVIVAALAAGAIWTGGAALVDTFIAMHQPRGGGAHRTPVPGGH